jgi:hypothetical protein
VQNPTEATSAWGDISTWNVAPVTNFLRAFSQHRNKDGGVSSNGNFRVAEMASSYFAGIKAWDTSSVKNMAYMFVGAVNQNADLSNWNTANVVTLFQTFHTK